jgi:putative ABC transport system permease protein
VRTLLRLSVRQMRARPGRSALTLLGIVIGVAAVVAVWASIGLVRGGFRAMFDSVSGRATFEVVAEGDAHLDPGLAADLAGVSGVEAAVPTVQGSAALMLDGKTAPVFVVGIDPARDREVRRYSLREGTFLEGPGVLLEGGFADSLGLGLGDGLVLFTARGPRPVLVTGLLEPEGAAIMMGGSVVFMRQADAQRLLGLGDRVSAVHLVLAEGAAEEQVRGDVERLLPVGAGIQRPASRGQLALDTMAGTELAMGNAAVLSVVLGAFIILNTFLMNLGERRRQLATLRACGATRGQVGRMILAEAALLGSIGGLLGVPLGYLVSWAMASSMQEVLSVPLPAISFGLDAVALALVLGPGVSMLAALLPALLTRGVSPLELVRRQAVVDPRRQRWAAAPGMVLLVGTAVLAEGLIAGRIGAEWSAASSALALASAIMIAPALLRPLVGGLGFLTRPLQGVTEVIALRQLLRSPLRNSLTVGVLGGALAMSIGMGNSVLSNVRNLREWTDRTIVGDFLVRSVMPDPMLTVVPSLPSSVGEEIAAIDGIDDVRPVKFLRVQVDGQRAMLLARELPADGSIHLHLTQGGVPDEVRAGLERGEVVLGQRLSQELGKGAGASVVLDTPSGPRSMKVAGTVTEFTGGGMALYLEWEQAQHLFEFEGADVFLIDAAHGQEPAVQADLEELTRSKGLLLQSHQGFRDLIDEMNAGVIGALWALLGVLFLVASFGVVNTLTMNVLEQTRELGLLRAVAMTRAQVRRTVVAQAAAMALVSFVPGGLAGLLLAYLMNAAAPALLGVELEFTLHWGFIASTFLVAGVITALAGGLPALRASRLDVVEALHYE